MCVNIDDVHETRVILHFAFRLVPLCVILVKVEDGIEDCSGV